MRMYDYWRQDPWNMDKGNFALVMESAPDREWMVENLNHIPKMIGIGDGDFLLRFAWRTDYDKVIATYGSQVYEKDPFGPDLCPRCEGDLKLTLFDRLNYRIKSFFRIFIFSDKPVRDAHLETIMGLSCLIPLTIEGSGNRTSPDNLRWMLDRCLQNLQTFPVDKLGRWVGFVQGVLALSGHLDVDEERERTRPFFHEAYKATGQLIPKTQNR